MVVIQVQMEIKGQKGEEGVTVPSGHGGAPVGKIVNNGTGNIRITQKWLFLMRWFSD